MRHLAFERGVNFRDFGGYDTANGRRVRWRRLFRCGQLSKLTDADLAMLESLGLELVCDFRGPDERLKQPSRLPAAVAGRVRELNIIPGAGLDDRDEIVALVSGRRSAAELRAASHAVYRQIVLDFAAAYRAMFAHLMTAKGAPVLIHCAGGKDRTGIGAALILRVLGVPDDTIMADYMLTAESDRLHVYLDRLIDHAAAQGPLPMSRAALKEQIVPLFGLASDWLDVAYAAMAEHAGSIDGYLENELRVTAADRAKLREWYLE